MKSIAMFASITLFAMIITSACGPENPEPGIMDGSVPAEASLKPDTVKPKPDGTVLKPDTGIKPDAISPDSAKLIPGTLVQIAPFAMKAGTSKDMCGVLERVHSSGKVIKIECHYLILEKTKNSASIEIAKGKAGFYTKLLAHNNPTGMSEFKVLFIKPIKPLSMKGKVNVKP